MLYLSNAFSLNMCASMDLNIEVSSFTPDMARDLLLTEQGFTSAVGHADTAAVIADQLGLRVPCNRVSVNLTEQDQLLVAQYKGPRLPEGTTVLPEGASITYALLNVRYF